MATSVLITQCLQHDFVAPIGAQEPLPNALHVGSQEARRLLGPDPERGPLAQLMHWARSQASEDKLEVIHIRDWHDPGDPSQADHLQHFGAHCLKGSLGAQLVLDLDEGVDRRQNEHFVNSLTLNDFEGTTLGGLLERFRAESSDGLLRAGVVGVWTEAKVSFLCYELLTRCQIHEIATCSALTASASRAQHFNGLSQLEKILGVQVLDSVGDFASWLDPEAPDIALPTSQRRGAVPTISWRNEALELSSEDLAILGFLYRDSAKLELTALGGGFSGAVVLRVTSLDAIGHEQAPSVAKLGPRALIGEERVAFEQVEAILGNVAPSVRGFADLGQRAGLKYAYASMGTGPVRTFKSIYEEGASQEQLDRILEAVFGDVLGRFTRAAIYDRLPLLEYYGFEARYGDGVRQRVAKLMGLSPGAEHIDFGHGYQTGNVADFYSRQLESLPKVYGESHYVSYLHGDLNGANILVDAADNVWLIDFFHAHRGHILKDVAKLENDLLYIFTPVEDEAALGQALLLTQRLRAVEDLAAPLPPSPSGLTLPAMRRAWATLRTLRGVMGSLCREDRDPQQLRIALLRYAVHTTSFDESSPLQKRWALAAACGLADDIVAAATVPETLRVDWIAENDLPGPGRLGLTICPGRRDRDRRLAKDLQTLQSVGTTRLVCLLPDDELEWLGVPSLIRDARAAGLSVDHLPIIDQGVPRQQDAQPLVDEIMEALQQGEKVVVHCMGGLGRSGTIAACVLATLGAHAPDQAIAAVRRARSPRAVENTRQESFVDSFYKNRRPDKT